MLDLQPQGYNVGHKATRVRIDSTLHRSSIITVCNRYLRTKTLLILIDLYYTTCRVYRFRITGATCNFQFHESSTTSVKPLYCPIRTVRIYRRGRALRRSDEATLSFCRRSHRLCNRNWSILYYVLSVKATKNAYPLTSRSLYTTTAISAARELLHGAGYAPVFAKDSKNERWYAPFSRLGSSKGGTKEEAVTGLRNYCTNWLPNKLATSAIYRPHPSRRKSFS